MPSRVVCPGCDTAAAVPDALVGKTVRCPACKRTFRADGPLASERDAPPARERSSRFRRDRDDPYEVRPSRPTRTARDGVDGGPSRVLIFAALAALALVFVVAGVGLVAAGIVWPHISAALPAPTDDPAATVPAVAHDGVPFHLAEVRKSVVFIKRLVPGISGTAVGTGFLVSQDGLVATNRHVIQDENGPAFGRVLQVGVPSVADPDTLDYFQADVAYCPPRGDALDFAILRIATRPNGPAFQALPLASARPALGDPVAAIGFPFVEIDQPVLSFNKGSISAARVEIEGHSYFQTDAAVNPGNSGGPLINADGEVVGVVSRRRLNANNMGYALYLSDTGMPASLTQLGAGPPVARPDAPPKIDPPRPAPPNVKTPEAAPPGTTDLDRMKAPDAPASGNLLGSPFKVDEASLDKTTGWLTLRQGTHDAPTAYVLIMGPAHSVLDLPGKTYLVPVVRPPGTNWYWIHLWRKVDGEDKPRFRIVGDGYAMRLEFGPMEGGKVTGKIVLSLPDAGQSVVAGTFVLME